MWLVLLSLEWERLVRPPTLYGQVLIAKEQTFSIWSTINHTASSSFSGSLNTLRRLNKPKGETQPEKSDQGLTEYVSSSRDLSLPAHSDVL